MKLPVRKLTKYFLRILAGCLVLFVLLYVGVVIYVGSHKPELIARAQRTIGARIAGKVLIGDLSVSAFNNFPYLSIALKDVEVRDSMFIHHRHRFFSASRLFLRLDPLSLCIGKVSINKIELDSGALYLFTDSSGYSNAYLMHPKTAKPAAEEKATAGNPLANISVARTAVIVDDRTSHKRFDFYINRLDLKKKLSGTADSYQVSQSILVRTLTFNPAMGGYLVNHTIAGDYALQYDAAKDELRFDSIPLRISDQLFYFTGAFSFGKVQRFRLRASTSQVLVDFAKTLLTPATQKGIDLVRVKAPVDASATLDGSLVGGEPLVTARWITSKNTITTPMLDFTNCSFQGSYINEVNRDSARNDPNSKIEIYGFSGDWRGLTMTSRKMIISNLTTPVVEADMQAPFQLAQFNEILQTESIAFTAGNGQLNVQYKGPIDHITHSNASLNGVFTIGSGNILMKASQANLSSCNARIRFVNSDVFIDKLDGRIHNDPIHISGLAKNALTLLGETPGNVGLALRISAPVINIDNLSSMLYRKLPAKKRTVTAAPRSIASTAQQLDNLLSSGNISIALSADKLVYHKFTAQKVSALLNIDANSWHLDKVALTHGTGNIFVTGSVTERAAGHYGLNANLQMRNVDARKVWYEFENFGIPALSWQNIRGLLSADATLSLLLDKAGNFNMNTLAGQADFSLKQGALINFKPLQDVQTFVLKNRDFSDISFAEIKDKINFDRGIITINRMEINSTALSFFVEGVYAIRGKTDISIQLPLSNLKKRSKGYVPENGGADRGGGMSVFLRATTADDGSIKIKYDPFKRFRKTPAGSKQ